MANQGGGESINKAFLADPRVAGNLGLLGEIGALAHIDALAARIDGYQALFAKGEEIFGCSCIDDIIKITVRQLSDRYSPRFIAFMWKPVQNRADITMRTYQEYKPVTLTIEMDSITTFESFFARHPNPISFADMQSKLNDAAALAPLREVKPEVIIPIISPFDLHGIVFVGRKIDGGDYSGDELAFLRQFMLFASQAIKAHLHYEHSLRDIKTGLYNHGFFMTRVKEEIARTKRSKCVSSIIMVDVDRFKHFNDEYGHLAGDQVLEVLAHVIKQNVRTEDVPSRFGGEEFTVLLPNADAETAWLVAERLRANVSAMHVPWETPLPQITISLGVFSFDHNSELEANEIIRRADEALYVSKERGRNLTTTWEPGLMFNVSPTI